MATNQEPSRNLFDHPVQMESAQDIVAPRHPPTRRDTQSSTTSNRSLPPFIPPGFYSLHLHGNCPRCHHHHKAATVKVRISGDLSHISPINCEKCGSPWLGMGGGNATSLSLLSTQTIDLDPVDTNFRSTLIEMVLSLTAALASVPETESGGASRDHSVRSNNSRGHDGHPKFSDGEKRGAHKHTRSTTPESKPPKTGTTVSKGRFSFFFQLGSRLGERFPIMKKLQPQRLSRFAKKPKMTAKGRGKLPVVQPSNTDLQRVPSRNKSNTAAPNNVTPESMGDDQDGSYSRAAIEAANLFEQNKEKLRVMSREQRAEWIREQLSDYACRCTRNCHCKRASKRTDVSDQPQQSAPPVPQIPSQYLSQQRRSSELFGVGGYFEGSGYVHPARAHRLSIESTTRLSQAATMVSGDSVTVTSRPSMPHLLAPSSQTRPGSGSPRLRSLTVGPPTSRLREQLEQDADRRRSSIDSLETSRAVRSIPVTSQQGGIPSSITVTTSISVDNEDLATLVDGFTERAESGRHSINDQNTPSLSTAQLEGSRMPDA